MGGRGEPQNLDDFAAEFIELATEFGKIFRGKLWALVKSMC